jgi:hypothetical protein
VNTRLLTLVFLAGCVSDYEVHAPVDVDPADVTDCGFTQVEETDFYRYDCNPVFTTTGESWAPNVGHTAFHVTSVLGHPFYQLWYVGVQNANEFGDYALGYAVSDAGTDWESSPANPLFNNPTGNKAWDKDAMDAMQVLWDPDTSQYVGRSGSPKGRSPVFPAMYRATSAQMGPVKPIESMASMWRLGLRRTDGY